MRGGGEEATLLLLCLTPASGREGVLPAVVLRPAERAQAPPPPRFRANGPETQGVRQGPGCGEAHSRRRPEAGMPQSRSAPWSAGRSLPCGVDPHRASCLLRPLQGLLLAPSRLASPAPDSWRCAAARGGSPASLRQHSAWGGDTPPELRAWLRHVLAVWPPRPLLQRGHSGL